MGTSYEFARNIEAAKVAGNDQALKAWEAQQNIFNSLKEAQVIQELPLEARPVQTQQPQEGKSGSERLVLRERFTSREKEALIKDGAVTYSLRGETILSQKEAQEAKGKPSFYDVVEAGDRLLDLPSRQIQVAIYPAPESFFVPDSFNRNVDRQDELVAEDAKNLRERLNLTAISEIIPEEAAALSEIVFQHLDATCVWLFGKKYAAAQGLDSVSGRTKNPTNSPGSFVADVGRAYPDYGLSVHGWDRDYGYHDVGAVRLVVPVENR